MSTEEIVFLITIVAMIAAIYFTYRVIQEFDKTEDEDDIWS